MANPAAVNDWRRRARLWGLVVGWLALAPVGLLAGMLLGMMTGLVGLLLGPVALGTVPAVCLGRYLGRNGEWLALDIAFGGGIVVLPLVAAVLGTRSADQFTAWMWAMAVAGTVLYALPLLIAGEVAARAARKRH